MERSDPSSSANSPPNFDLFRIDQQMRQAQDLKFRKLLSRARAAALTEDDLALLNQKVVTSLCTPELENATTIVKVNVLRHHINHIKMEHFARSRSQRIFVFPAQHSRVKSTPQSAVYLENLLQQMDQDAGATLVQPLLEPEMAPHGAKTSSTRLHKDPKQAPLCQAQPWIRTAPPHL